MRSVGRVWLVRDFERFVRRNRLGDAALLRAVREADAGILAADLPGRLVKLRIPREGGGKSGGFRTIVAYEAGERASGRFSSTASRRTTKRTWTGR